MEARALGTKKVRLWFLGGTALVLGLTGAVGGAPGVDPLSGVCALITQQEAATALGAPVPAGTEKTMKVPMQARTIDTEFCFFGTEVSVARYALGSEAPALFGQYRQSLSSEEGYQSVDGVGDEAFAAKGQLAVRKGETGLIIDVGQARGGGAKELDAEKVLAALAVGRL